MADVTAAAFFDLDNTLLRGSSMIHLAVGFYRHGYLSNRVVGQAFWREGRFRRTGVENGKDRNWSQEVALSGIAGKPVTEVEHVVADVFDTRLAKRLWPGTRELADRHLEAGDEVWVVTGSPVEVAQIVAERFGFTGGLGTVAERADGHYTGRLEYLMHGQGKRTAVEGLIAERDLDPARCSAYSDSANDLPLLELVGQPHVVNPDPTLRQHATRRDWPVHDFVHRHPARNWVGMGAAASVAAAGYLAQRRRLLRRRTDSPEG